MTLAAVGLGSNVGDRTAHLTAAVRAIQAIGPTVVSRVYETEPVGGPPGQQRYLNAVARVATALAPLTLLERLQQIERGRGRTRRERWAPRTLDLDILLYGEEMIDEPGLRVPHPRLLERRFMLEPLIEVWPEDHLPDGTSLREALASAMDQDVYVWDEGTAH